MRLIDGDALREKFQNLAYDDWNQGTTTTWANAYSEVADMVEDAPTVEPMRKKGEWMPVDSFSAFGGDEVTWMAHGNPVAFHYCSVCKEQAYADENGEEILSAFCPLCGADMREGGEE